MSTKIIAKLPTDRTKEGEIRLLIDDAVQGLWRCRGKADSAMAAHHGNPSRDPTHEWGDHPAGMYNVVAVTRNAQTTFRMKENNRMNCSEVMTSDPTFCVTTETAFHAAQLMKREDVGPIPIVGDRETKVLKGIVTDRDLVLKVVAEARDPKTTRVEEVMTTLVATCRFDDDADKAIELMQQHQVRRIPIVDGDGHLVGIISQADVATRVDEPKKTAEVVEEISKAASTHN